MIDLLPFALRGLAISPGAAVVENRHPRLQDRQLRVAVLLPQIPPLHGEEISWVDEPAVR